MTDATTNSPILPPDPAGESSAPVAPAPHSAEPVPARKSIADALDKIGTTSADFDDDLEYDDSGDDDLEAEPSRETEGGPLRDPKTGKFKAREAAEGGDDEDAEGADDALEWEDEEPELEGEGEAEGEEEETEGAEEEEEPDEFSTPPAWLRRGAQAEWAKAPKAVREEVTRRISELDEGISRYQEFTKPLLPWAELAQKHQTSIPQVLEQYVAYRNDVLKDPIGGLARVCDDLGLNFQQIIAQAANMPPEQVHQFQNQEVTQLRNMVGQLNQQITGLQKQITEGASQKSISEVEAFAAKHSDFRELEGDILYLIEQRGFDNLPAAYREAKRLRGAPVEAQRSGSNPPKTRRKASAQTRQTSQKSIGGPRPSGADTASPVSPVEGSAVRKALSRLLQQVRGALMALTSTAKLQEAFSLALEDRSRGYQDLVSNANAILYQMKQMKQFRPFQGPTIRERLLYNETGTYTRYSGSEFLNPQPVELINDAEFSPKLAAVSVMLTNEQILQNRGSRAQLENIMTVHMEAAETELQDRFVEDLHGDGTLDGGRQIGGLQLAIPTDPTTGTYAGIDRSANAIWRTTTYDANSDFPSITGVDSASVKTIFDTIMIERSRGKKGPTMVCASADHYLPYTAATVAIQRIQDENGLGKLGFTNLRYYGAGRSVDVVLEGGIGSAMPANVTYFVDHNSLRFRYHPDRNFVRFGGRQMPINQDALVQHVGFYGEITLTNPLHMVKLYDSSP